MRIWTFQLVGGSQFAIQPDGNPPVSHDGSLSIWHLRLTDEQAEEVEGFCQAREVKVTKHADVVTEEQEAMHQRYMEADTSVFPCGHCPNCYWLDLQVEHYCGHAAWVPERRRAALETFEQAHTDLEACPLWERLSDDPADATGWVPVEAPSGM
jgi:hypothetical protein